MNQIRILLAEGESNPHGALPDLLKSDGYIVDNCRDGLQAENRAISEIFDLIVLNATLPSQNGFEVCRHLRQNGIHTPILMLGTKDLNHKLEGFKSGSDDYLAKPFEIPELQARIEALLRRAYKAPHRPLTSYELDGVHIDFIKSIVLKDEKTTILRKRERELLRYLMERKGRVLSRDEIIQAVWTYAPLRTRSVDVHIAWLRQKIEWDPQNPQYIITVHGEGYRFTHECSDRERLSGKV